MATSWTDEQLIEAVKTSSGITEVVLKLYKGFAGSHFPTVRKHIARLGIDISRLNGRIGPNGRGKPIFQIGRVVRSSTLRKAFKAVSEYRCVECGNEGLHKGKSLTLQLDHVDGNDSNNFETNLRWLCPNCHTQTPTYGKTKSVLLKKGRGPRPRIDINCSGCGKKYSINKSSFESKSRAGQEKFYCNKRCGRPNIDTIQLIESYKETGSYRAVGKKFGISDVSVAKRIAGSSSGRMGLSESPHGGSNPPPAANPERSGSDL